MYMVLWRLYDYYGKGKEKDDIIYRWTAAPEWLTQCVAYVAWKKKVREEKMEDVAFLRRVL